MGAYCSKAWLITGNVHDCSADNAAICITFLHKFFCAIWAGCQTSYSAMFEFSNVHVLSTCARSPKSHVSCDGEGLVSGPSFSVRLCSSPRNSRGSHSGRVRIILPLCTTCTRSLRSNDHFYLFIAYCIMTQSVSDSTLSPAPFSPFSSYSEVSGVTSDGACLSCPWPRGQLDCTEYRNKQRVDSASLQLFHGVWTTAVG